MKDLFFFSKGQSCKRHKAFNICPLVCPGGIAAEQYFVCAMKMNHAYQLLLGHMLNRIGGIKIYILTAQLGFSLVIVFVASHMG